MSTTEAMSGTDPTSTDPFAALLDESAPEVFVPEGEQICAAGEEPDEWWYVIDGFADVTRNGHYLGTIGPGEMIGEISMLDGRPRTATVVAKSDMRVRVGVADDFLAAILAFPELAMAVTRQMATRFRDLTERSVSRRPPVVEPTPSGTTDEAVPGVATPERVAFNPQTPEYFADPHIQLGQIREQEAVHVIELTGAYLFTRYEHVHALARDRRLGVEIAHALPNPSIDAERQMLASMPDPTLSILRRDGDEHSRVRRLMQKAFTPKAIGLWRARASEVTDRLLDDLAERGGGDLIGDYALQLPVQIISDMLGMPTDQVPSLRAWSHALTKTLDPLCSPGEREAAVSARVAMEGYLAEIYDVKRLQPDDGILSALMRAEVDGDRLTRSEVLVNVLLLYVAGHETTTNLIGNGAVELFRHPDQLDLVRTNPDLDANLIEEVLRYNSPVQITRRISREEIEVAGVRIPAGSVIMLAGAAANRDPRKWGATADQFLVGRVGANDQVSFGGGPHFCLGAALARLEGQIALPRLMRRFPRLHPTAEPVFEPRMVLRGVGRLLVTTV